MELFFKLEAGYLAIGLFALAITLIVTTRSFVPKGLWKKAIPLMTMLLAIFIGTHYFVTSQRINEVETAFTNNEKVIWENRAIRKVSQSVTIEKSNEWTLENHMLSSPNYSRDFFTARCIKYVAITLEESK